MFPNLIEKAYAAIGDPMTTTNPSGGRTSTIGDYDTLLKSILDNIGEPLVALLLGLAVVYFLYGVFVFIRNADSPEKRSEGGQHILWGAVGMAIMVSAYGIINLILGTIGK